MGGRLLCRLSSISSGVKRKKEEEEKIHRPARPADAGPGGLKNQRGCFS